MSSATTAVLLLIEEERAKQERKREEFSARGRVWVSCASPEMDPREKLCVLTEEVGEVAQALNDERDNGLECLRGTTEGDMLRGELIQVAAVASAWAESLL